MGKRRDNVERLKKLIEEIKAAPPKELKAPEVVPEVKPEVVEEKKSRREKRKKKDEESED